MSDRGSTSNPLRGGKGRTMAESTLERHWYHLSIKYSDEMSVLCALDE